MLNWNAPAVDFYHSVGAMSEWTTMRVSNDALATLAGQRNQPRKHNRTRAARLWYAGGTLLHPVNLPRLSPKL